MGCRGYYVIHNQWECVIHPERASITRWVQSRLQNTHERSVTSAALLGLRSAPGPQQHTRGGWMCSAALASPTSFYKHNAGFSPVLSVLLLVHQSETPHG